MLRVSKTGASQYSDFGSGFPDGSAELFPDGPDGPGDWEVPGVSSPGPTGPQAENMTMKAVKSATMGKYFFILSPAFLFFQYISIGIPDKE
jgi:hypothetical protein